MTGWFKKLTGKEKDDVNVFDPEYIDNMKAVVFMSMAWGKIKKEKKERRK